ncbi:antibiotic biosynthesis monooxygenase family protein [Salinispora oceanensis]|uniref:antibiotic biosynthesis monooxygenase family protein n=1 Tax=Salinispora oceanensis TaxID=1050199 RepID=UPI00035E7DF8|nr:antibiotic biosynthesis monooxygenase family protein [Salinispora oceanensis]
MSLRVLLQIDIRPGWEEDFERLWYGHARYVNRLGDNHGQSLLRRTDGAGGYVVLTDWTNEPAFRAFEQSPEQQSYLKKLWPMRQGGSMSLLTVVTELAGTA